jgi:hypothetical protein
LSTPKSSEPKRLNNTQQTGATAKEANSTSYAGAGKVAREGLAHRQVIRVNKRYLQAAVDLPHQAKSAELAVRILKALTRASISEALISKRTRTRAVPIQKTLFPNMKVTIELRPMQPKPAFPAS